MFIIPFYIYLQCVAGFIQFSYNSEKTKHKNKRGTLTMNKMNITPTKIAKDAMLLTSDNYIISTMFCNPFKVTRGLNK